MDGDRFDALTRTFRTRRAALQHATGGLAALLGVAGIGEAAGKCVRIGQRCKKDGKKLACCGGAKCKGTRCKCTGGRQVCGGRCRAACPPLHLRNAQTCGCCGDSGADCDTDADCCSGQCLQLDAQTKLCICITVTGGCGANRECCSGNCQAGACTCSPAGRPCGNTFDCCDGLTCGANFRCAA